jgi:hypothetical protein
MKAGMNGAADMNSTLRLWVLILAMPLGVVPLHASAADAKAEVPMRDPWVPPAVRQSASAPLTHGAALHAQVESKLRSSFDAADVEHAGSITLDQARAANLGMIASNFDRIDTRRNGRVSFEDVKRFLKGRGASTL